jgi:CRISPR-associated protein Csx14
MKNQTYKSSNTTLVATLGGQPQVVTYLLDLLLARGEAVDQVRAVYIAPYLRSKTAFERLSKEFADGRYAGYPCSFHGHPIQTGGSDLPDIRTPEEVEAVRQSMTALLKELKEQRHTVHLGLSGGRRLISLTALAAAMQYLTPADRLWHIHVPTEFEEKTRDGAIMHAPTDAGVRLIAVPFVPWVAYIPGLATLLKRSPREMGEAAYGWLDEDERARCSRVWEALTQRQKEVLRAFASGLSRQEVAEKLSIAVTTVDSHRDSILEQCELSWQGQSGEDFNVQALQKYFGPFLSGLDQLR